MQIHETKARLLDAAEALFAAEGLDAASVRAITARAGANIAAVNYHFGNRDALIQEVYRRRLGPLNKERLRRLSAARESKTPVPVEVLVRALIEPALELSDDASAAVMKLMGRVFTQPSDFVKRILDGVFEEMISQFLGSFQESLPHLPLDRLVWRVHFVIGSMAHTMCARDFLPKMMEDRVDISSVPVVDELVGFCAEGLRANLADESVQKDSVDPKK